MLPQLEASSGLAWRIRRPHQRSTVLALLLLFALPGEAAAEDAMEQSRAAAEVAFAHGMLAFQNREAEEAARLFKDAVGYDPEHGTAQHWLGLTCLRLGRAAEAVAALEASLAAERPPQAGRRRVQEDLALARARLGAAPTDRPVSEVVAPEYRFESVLEDLPRWEGRVFLEGGYDSNPGLVSEDLSTVPFPDLPEAAADGSAGLDVRLEHHPFYGRRGWSLGLAFAGQQILYQELEDLDMSLVQGTLSLAWGKDLRGLLTGPLGYTRVPLGPGRISALLQAGGSYASLGGEAFLRLSAAAASVKVRESAWTATRIELAAWDRTYLQDDLETTLLRSGEEIAVGVHQDLIFHRQDRYLRPGFVAGRRRLEGRAFDADFGEARAELSLPIASRWALFLLTAGRKERFEHPESNLANQAGPLREDTVWRGAATLVWHATDHLHWSLRGSYTQRDSNLVVLAGTPLLDYERTAVSGGIEWSF